MLKQIPLALLACSLTFAYAQDANQKPLTLKTDREKMSYALGYTSGQHFTLVKTDVDPQLILKGFEDGLLHHTPPLHLDQIHKQIKAYYQQLEKTVEDNRMHLAEKNLTEGQAYLEANAKKEGVTTTASGLQYKVIESGEGKQPKATDNVTVDYEGHTVDGRVFDSSYRRGKPATFPVNGVIQGWVEALQLMHEGDLWELTIPAELAYGERGAPGSIAPNSVLIFKVHLISIGD